MDGFSEFYCIELHYSFDSEKLAHMFEYLGLTVIRKNWCVATIGY